MPKFTEARNVDSLSKQDILEDGERKAQKHRRKQFSEYLEEDEAFTGFEWKSKDEDFQLDEETIAKYLKRS
jgi:hypothetical protein